MDVIKIMLVDDSQLFLNMIKEVINTDVKFETEIVSFSDARIAKEKLLHIDPHFIITDIEMPHYDGMQFIEHIKSVSTATILAISGSNFKDNSTKTILHCAQALGADYGMIKDDISEKMSLLITDIINKHCIDV